MLIFCKLRADLFSDIVLDTARTAQFKDPEQVFPTLCFFLSYNLIFSLLSFKKHIVGKNNERDPKIFMNLH